ncbi:unnamed protein product [Amoebophrya sp. A120]|nr:unnamed protein product [Amoebophrya sp. A120]|eukprot:GSA120T00020520001.1
MLADRDGAEGDETQGEVEDKDTAQTLHLLSYLLPLCRLAKTSKKSYFDVEVVRGGSGKIEMATQCSVALKWLKNLGAQLSERCGVAEDGESGLWDFPPDEIGKAVMEPLGAAIGPGSGRDFTFYADAKALGFPLVQFHILPGYTLLRTCTSCGFIAARQRKSAKSSGFAEKGLQGYRVCSICFRVIRGRGTTSVTLEHFCSTIVGGAHA